MEYVGFEALPLGWWNDFEEDSGLQTRQACPGVLICEDETGGRSVEFAAVTNNGVLRPVRKMSGYVKTVFIP